VRYKPYVVATLMLISSGAAASAQVLAPGPALPGNAVTGGIGPGTTRIAPGLATGPLIEQEGPGGIPLAIGSNEPTRPARHRSRRERAPHPLRPAAAAHRMTRRTF
jgi:hypothetical protein